MTLTIELTPEQEAKLSQAAQRAGVKPEDLACKLIDEMPGTVSEVGAKKTLIGYRMFAEFGGGAVEELHQERARDKERENREFAA